MIRLYYNRDDQIRGILNMFYITYILYHIFMLHILSIACYILYSIAQITTLPSFAALCTQTPPTCTRPHRSPPAPLFSLLHICWRLLTYALLHTRQHRASFAERPSRIRDNTERRTLRVLHAYETDAERPWRIRDNTERRQLCICLVSFRSVLSRMRAARLWCIPNSSNIELRAAKYKPACSQRH